MLNARLRKNLDVTLLILMLLVISTGMLFLYSVSRSLQTSYFQKQLVWFCMGLVGLVVASSIEYERFARFARHIYAFNLFCLIIVFKLGHNIKGAMRWINIGGFVFQPSEFAKLFMIICLAVFLARREKHIKELGTLLGSLVYIGVPTLLIFKQPDLGTALVLMSIWFGMTAIAGAKAKHLIGLLVVGSVLFAGMWHFNILRDYQKARMVAFINPEADRQDAGYHVIQARIAVGSGQVWGKGIGHGTQVQGRFIPENHTDFIFTVVGEEGGFIVCTILVLLYAGILFRAGIAVAQAENTLGRLLAAGIASMYAFHIIVNMGMTIGIMPVTGVPLPLISYGGSNLLLNMTAIGLLLGVGMRRHRLVF